MSERLEPVEVSTELLMRDYEIWKGRLEFAERQVERIRRELGARGMKGGLILLEGGQA